MKIVLNRDYAANVIPHLMEIFQKTTYADLFKLSLGVLAFHARVLEKDHRVVEVDSEGNYLGYLSFPEIEGIAALQQYKERQEIVEKLHPKSSRERREKEVADSSLITAGGP